MNSFNVTDHLQSIAAGRFTVFTVQRTPKMFQGKYTLPGIAKDFPFCFYPNESIPTLLRLKYIEDTASNGRELQVATLREHPTVFEDLQKEWQPFEDYFPAFEKGIRDYHNFCQQVIADMAAKVLERSNFYTQNRFTEVGFAGMPWFGMLLHYEARRHEPNNLRWLKEAYELQQTEDLTTPEFIWQLITEKTPEPCG